MRQSIGRGNIAVGLLGSKLRQLSECNCPNQGFVFREQVKKYGVLDADVTPLTVTSPNQVWAVRGKYSQYSTDGQIINLKPLGRWRIKMHLEVYFRKIPAGDDHDILKCNLVQFQTDIFGDNPRSPNLVKRVGNKGIVLEGIPAGEEPTWQWDLTKGPFVFDDYIDVEAETRYCYIAFDTIFTENDRSTNANPDYFLGTLTMTPYANPVNSDPLFLFNGTNFHQNPMQPPCGPGNWDLPLPDFLAGGAVPVSDGRGGGATMASLDANYPGWRASRTCWQSHLSVQRAGLQALFKWALLTGPTVRFFNVSMTDAPGFSVMSYVWDFGDGTTSTVQNPDHTYAANGRYHVTLTATDSSIGQVSVFDQFVDLTLHANFSFTAPRNVIRGGQPVAEVNFTDQSIGSVTIWDWDFGDGSPHGTTANPIHDYPRGGQFQCKLTVGDGVGASSITKPVNT